MFSPSPKKHTHDTKQTSINRPLPASTLQLHQNFLHISLLQVRPNSQNHPSLAVISRSSANMAGSYYYQNRPCYSYCQAPPLHLCFFLLILFLFMGFSWYINYESVFESVVDQFKLVVMASPLVLLLVVHWLSSEEKTKVPFLVPLPEKEAFHRAGSSPWGVGFLLVFLMFMISYQSSFHERWFPLISR